MSIVPSPKAPSFAPSPRSEITYEIETMEGIEQRKLPFIIGVMADLSASRDPAAPDLKDRRFNDVTRTDFDNLVRAIAPRLRYKVGNVLTNNPDGDLLAIELQFQSFDDFQPDRVAAQVTVLRKLLERRVALDNLRESVRNNPKFAQRLVELSADDGAMERIARSPHAASPAARTSEPGIRRQIERRQVEYLQRTEGGTGSSYIPVEHYGHGPGAETVAGAPAVEEPYLLDRILDESRIGRTPEERARWKEWIQAFFDELSQGSIAPVRNAEAAIHNRIAELDELVSRQLGEIMHAPEFQRLEAAWCGLHYLASLAEDIPSVKIKVLDVSKRELWETFQQAPGLQSPMFRKIFDETFGTVDGLPYSILLADYEFGRHPQDVDVLVRLSEIAEAANAPLVTNASPELLDLESFTGLPAVPELAKVFNNEVYVRWNMFRRKEPSRLAVLTLPRVLMRAPYSGDEEGPFRFDEGVDGTDHWKYLWGGAAWVLAACLADAFDGFTAEVRGLERGGIPGLIMHRYRDAAGIMSKPPAEIAIDARMSGGLRSLGLNVLRCSAETSRAGFFDLVTCNALQYVDVDPGDQACSVRLDYILAVCRIAQYVRCIMRDRAGLFDNARQCEEYLNSWIGRYVAREDSAAEPFRPLLGAWFQVYSFGEHGLAVEGFLRPALRAGELKAPLRTCLSAAIFGKRLQEMVDEASARRTRPDVPRAPLLAGGRQANTVHAADVSTLSFQRELVAHLSAGNGSARDRFHTNLTLAELLVALGKPDVAASIVESLLREAEEFHVDRWESPVLLERLYRAAKLSAPNDGNDSDRPRRAEIIWPPALKPPGD